MLHITPPRSATLCLATLLSTQACAGPAPGDTTPDPEPVVGEHEDLRPRDGDEALEWLLAGNARFIAGRPRHAHETLMRRAQLAAGQHPFAIVLACADSRVAPELVFDHGLGDLFVIRVAGNVLAENEAGSIEYAVEHLDVPLIVVLGHEGCGAVTAALGMFDDEAKELAGLLKQIQPALQRIDPSLPRHEKIQLGVESNALQSVDLIRAIAARGEPKHDLRIVGAVYEISTGRVRVLDH